MGSSFASAFFLPSTILCDDHLAHCIDPLSFEEHMLRPAEPYAFGPESDRYGSLIRLIGVGPDTKFSRFISPLHDKGKILVDFGFLRFQGLVHEHPEHLRGNGLHLSDEYLTGRAIERDVIALLDRVSL